MLHPSYQVDAFLLGERIPDGHVGSIQTAADRVVQILVGRQSSGRSGAALKNTQGEISRLGIKPRRVFAVAVAKFAVATNAVPAISCGSGMGIPGDVADV